MIVMIVYLHAAQIRLGQIIARITPVCFIETKVLPAAEGIT